MIQAGGRIAFRALVLQLARLAVRRPHFAYRVADGIGLLVWRRRLRVERLLRFFPELPPSVAGSVCNAAGRFAMRNHILIECMRTAGMNPVRAIVDVNEQLAILRPPLILGTFHVGALPSLGAALERLPAKVLVLRSSPRVAPDITPTLEVLSTRGDEQHRALVFHTALERLGAGGFVFMPLDPEESVRIPAPFRGGMLQLARGPLAM